MDADAFEGGHDGDASAHPHAYEGRPYACTHANAHSDTDADVIAIAAADEEGEGDMPIFDDVKHAALVADVATDPSSGWVLEEAIGRVFEIAVVVPDGQGGLYLARGGVFSCYEFPWPMEDRLTDEARKEMLAAGRAPARPTWTDSFVAE